MEDIFVGETVTPTDAVEALPVLRIDEPTLQMTFLVNNSPFAGREGKWVTSRKIEERLWLSCKRMFLSVLTLLTLQINGLFQVVVNCTCLS